MSRSEPLRGAGRSHVVGTSRQLSSPAQVTVRVDGRVLRVEPGITVAAALQNAGLGFRRSVTGEVRGPLCGMGICHECRVTIGGVAHRRACLVVVEPGMEIRTGV